MASVLYLVNCPSVQVNPDRFVQCICSYLQSSANIKKLICSSEDGPMSIASKFASAIPVSTIFQDFQWDRKHTNDFIRSEIRLPNLVPGGNDFGLETEEDFRQRMIRICRVEFGYVSVVLATQTVLNTACVTLKSRETNPALVVIEQENMYSQPRVKMTVKNEDLQSFQPPDFRRTGSARVPINEPMEHLDPRHTFFAEKIQRSKTELGDSFFQGIKEGIMKVVREVLSVSQGQNQAGSLPQALKTVESRVNEEVQKISARLQRIHEDGINAARDSMLKTIELVRGEFETLRKKVETKVAELNNQQEAVLRLLIDLKKQITTFKPPAEVALNKLLQKVACYEAANLQVEDALLTLKAASKVEEKGYPVEILDAENEELSETIAVKVNNKKKYGIETLSLVLAREDRKLMIPNVKLAPGNMMLKFKAELLDSEKDSVSIVLVQGEKEVSNEYSISYNYQESDGLPDPVAPVVLPPAQAPRQSAQTVPASAQVARPMVQAVPPSAQVARPVEEIKSPPVSPTPLPRDAPLSQPRLTSNSIVEKPALIPTFPSSKPKAPQAGPLGLQGQSGNNDRPAVPKIGIAPGPKPAPLKSNPGEKKPEPGSKATVPMGLLPRNNPPLDERQMQLQKLDEVEKTLGTNLNPEQKEKLMKFLKDPKNQGLSINDLVNSVYQ